MIRPIEAYLTPEQRERLLALKRQYRPFLRLLTRPEVERLRFVRWLLESGRVDV